MNIASCEISTLGGVVGVEIPHGSRIIAVEYAYKFRANLFWLEDGASTNARYFKVVTTGEDIRTQFLYIGTLKDGEGATRHVIEVPRPADFGMAHLGMGTP